MLVTNPLSELQNWKCHLPSDRMDPLTEKPKNSNKLSVINISFAMLPNRNSILIIVFNNQFFVSMHNFSWHNNWIKLVLCGVNLKVDLYGHIFDNVFDSIFNCLNLSTYNFVIKCDVYAQQGHYNIHIYV